MPAPCKCGRVSQLCECSLFRRRSHCLSRRHGCPRWSMDSVCWLCRDYAELVEIGPLFVNWSFRVARVVNGCKTSGKRIPYATIAHHGCGTEAARFLGMQSERCQNRTRPGRRHPNVARLGPNSANIGRLWPVLGGTGQGLTEFGRLGPATRLGRTRPSIV